MTVHPEKPLPKFLAGCGAPGQIYAAADWAGFERGAPDIWPDFLKHAVSLLLHAQVPMAILWGKDAVMLHNRAYGELIGKPDFEALGKSIFQAFPQFEPFLRDVTSRVFNGETIAVRDRPTILERGGKRQEVWLNHDYSPLVDAEGGVCAVFSIYKETTERIRVEQRLNFAQEAGGVGTFEWYPDKGNLDVSDEYRRIWGLEPDVDVTDSLLVSLLVPEDRRKTGPNKLNDENPLAYTEYRRRDAKTGEIRWLARQGKVISASGVSVRRFVGTVMDITDRKNAEAALRYAEERFRTLAQAMTNHLWTATPDGLLDWCNGRIYDYSGFAIGELHGELWARMVHPDDFPASAVAWANALQSGSLYEAEFRLRRKDGVYRWFITRATPVRDQDGTIQYWIGNNTDIDDRKVAEQELAALAITLEERVEARTLELNQTQEVLRQSQKMEAIGNLTGGIAHDFNNLLQVVGGNLQMLQREIAGNGQAERYSNNAMEGVSRGAHLASQLLAFGRRQPLAPKVINIGRLLHGMDHMLRRVLGAAIDLKTVVAGDLWNTLIDPGNLENALLNLSINARDAMNGAGMLTIEANNTVVDRKSRLSHRDIEPGQYVVVSVSDTGHGMSKDVIAKAFDPFFTTKPQGKGSGLGLSMVYGFVKQSGGHVRIYSEVNEGTTIRLYIPHSTEAEELVAEQDTSPVVGGTETILVVEDDDAVRTTVVAMLSGLGYRVLKAKDALSAVGVIESGLPIDLVFTDVIMPGPMSAEEMAQRASVLLPGVKIVFTSGYTEGSIVHSGRLDAGVELLSKPYTQDALARKLRQVLGPAKQPNVPEKAKPAVAASLRILLCEDDDHIRLNLTEMLEDFGHDVRAFATAAEALTFAAQSDIDILITDVNLPDISGLELMRQLRGTYPDLLVIFASGETHIDGLEFNVRTKKLLKPFTVQALQEALTS